MQSAVRTYPRTECLEVTASLLKGRLRLKRAEGFWFFWAQVPLGGVRGNWHFLLPFVLGGFYLITGQRDVCYVELLLDQMWANNPDFLFWFGRYLCQLAFLWGFPATEAD